MKKLIFASLMMFIFPIMAQTNWVPEEDISIKETFSNIPSDLDSIMLRYFTLEGSQLSSKCADQWVFGINVDLRSLREGDETDWIEPSCKGTIQRFKILPTGKPLRYKLSIMANNKDFKANMHCSFYTYRREHLWIIPSPVKRAALDCDIVDGKGNKQGFLVASENI